MIKIKRIYDTVSRDDGFRILVDRLWPRGLSKENAKMGSWMKDIAPSEALRKWFSHNEARWTEFRRRYFSELDSRKEDIELIIERSEKGTVTLLYAAKDEKYNNAAALKEYIEKIS